MPVSPAGKGRARKADQALDQNRAGQDQNRNAADTQVPPSHGDPPRSRNTPNTYPGGRP